MDRDKQLPLNFEPSQESHAPASQILRIDDARPTLASKGAEILCMPSKIDRERKNAADREAELLKRVLRRAWNF
ncbi:hypothetical protein [Pandoraea cepalis]|uniref:hypothetical protein n=1 Tax=Pandoraea cepalis TaxID=2508294 RepID=UPI00123FF746|nr:hypothetical protein [Pandoraea cepalis]